MKILHDLYEHDFGLLLPCKSGVTWEHQTDGVLCNHIFIEGVFLPLPTPHGDPHRRVFKRKEKFEPNNLLHQLMQANYKGTSRNKTEIRRIWQEIDKALFFRYKKTEAPKGQPPNQEGIRWIIVTEIKKLICGYKLTEWDYEARKRDYGSLIGKKVALIYPNCD